MINANRRSNAVEKLLYRGLTDIEMPNKQVEPKLKAKKTFFDKLYSMLFYELQRNGVKLKLLTENGFNNELFISAFNSKRHIEFDLFEFFSTDNIEAAIYHIADKCNYELLI